MRTVFNYASDVAHLWAHQMQDSACTSRHNFHFDGKYIYSYQEVEGVIRQNANGTPVYITNSCSTTNTTCKHRIDIYKAIPHGAYWFHTEDCKSPDFVNGCRHNYFAGIIYIAKQYLAIIDLLGKQKRARTSDYSYNIANIIKTLNLWASVWDLDKRNKWDRKMQPDYNTFFNNRKKVENLIGIEKHEVPEIMQVHKIVQSIHGRDKIDDNVLMELLLDKWFDNEVVQLLQVEREKQKKQARKLEKQRVQSRIKENMQKLKKWHSCEIEGLCLDYEFYNCYKWDTALRLDLKNNRIETSKGIRLSIDEGKRLWSIILMFEKCGFRHELATDINGLQWKFNSYDNHVLTAGCHKIHYSEMENIAKTLGWVAA